MSRASDVRDAIIEELQERFPAETIESFYVPDYTVEELITQRRVAVANAGREFVIDQGPDTRSVVVAIGVCGALPEKTGESNVTYRSQVVAACDTFDTLLESIAALWTPDGVLTGTKAGMAGHRFLSLEQTQMFDPRPLYESGIYLSMLRVTYVDQEDT